jgi:hypothetical protein
MSRVLRVLPSARVDITASFNYRAYALKKHTRKLKKTLAVSG